MFDDYPEESKKSLKLATKPNGCNTICTIIINTVMGVYFAIYAFNNPDEHKCYVACNEEWRFWGSECYPFENQVENSVNVSKYFYYAFLTGFVLSIVNLMYAGVCALYLLYEQKTMLKTASFCVILSGFLTISWLIYASIVIFSNSGQICMDSFLPQSGKFIYVWLIIVYVCIGFFLLVCILCCCIMARKAESRKQAKLRN